VSLHRIVLHHASGQGVLERGIKYGIASEAAKLQSQSGRSESITSFPFKIYYFFSNFATTYNP
jgi:hypothetical protein